MHTSFKYGTLIVATFSQQAPPAEPANQTDKGCDWIKLANYSFYKCASTSWESNPGLQSGLFITYLDKAKAEGPRFGV